MHLPHAALCFRLAPLTYCRPVALVSCALLPLLVACGTQSSAASGEDRQSGQTGSPNNDPPDYISPTPQQPDSGDFTDGEGGVQSPELIPNPPPPPDERKRVRLGDVLLVSSGSGLLTYDVSDPLTPELLSAHEVPEPQIVRADELSEVSIVFTQRVVDSLEEVPEELIPAYETRLVRLDLSDPSQPVQLSDHRLPVRDAFIAADADGYTLVGGDLQEEEYERCGLDGEIGRTPAAESLWLRRLSVDGEALEERGRLDFPAGHWVLTPGQDHAAYVSTGAWEVGSEPFELELFDLRSIETQLSLQLSPADLGQQVSPFVSIDVKGNLAAIAGGSQLSVYDLATAELLDQFELGQVLGEVSFTDDGRWIALGAAGLVAIEDGEDGAVPSLSLVPFAAPRQWPLTAALSPFGDGFIGVFSVGTGEQTPESFGAARYEVTEGQLTLVDEVVTDWIYRANWHEGRSWNIDAERERLVYSLPVDDTPMGRLALVTTVDGALTSSSFTQVERVSPRPLSFDEGLIAVSSSRLQPLSVQDAALEANEALVTAREYVREEFTHAGKTWAEHRTHYGETYLSHRDTDDVSAPGSIVELPHVVDVARPLDDSHLLVMGLSVFSECEALAGMSGPEPFAECGPAPDGSSNFYERRNGFSVLTVEDGEVQVVHSEYLADLVTELFDSEFDVSLNWDGWFESGPKQLTFMARHVARCHSYESCEALGVTPSVSVGTSSSPGCASEESCEPVEPVVMEFVEGNKSQAVLITVDLSEPETPAIGEVVSGGARPRLTEPEDYDLGRYFLSVPNAGDDRAWGYVFREYVRDAQGNDVYDELGGAAMRYYLQLIESQQGSVRFGELVNVPGEAFGILRGTEETDFTLFTIGAEFDDTGAQSMMLYRLGVADGVARVEHSAPLGQYVQGAQQVGDTLAALVAPGDYCSPDTRFEVVTVDISDASLPEKGRLELPQPWGYYFSPWLELAPDPGTVSLGGGPASGNGRLVIDVESGAPELLRYDTY